MPLQTGFDLPTDPAAVKIEQQPPNGDAGSPNGGTQSPMSPDDRRVTVVGNPEAQWKAQYLIYEKLRDEAYTKGSNEEQRLVVEVLVPSSHVGRIIGRGGQNVREMQKLTGAVIKLPSQQQQQQKEGEDQTQQPSVPGAESPVHIIGQFYSVQVRKLVVLI